MYNINYIIIFLVKNGHTTADLYVYLLTHEHGKQYIVNAAKKLCKDVNQNPAILQNFQAKEFDSYVKGNILLLSLLSFILVSLWSLYSLFKCRIFFWMVISSSKSCERSADIL